MSAARSPAQDAPGCTSKSAEHLEQKSLNLPRRALGGRIGVKWVRSSPALGAPHPCGATCAHRAQLWLHIQLRNVPQNKTDIKPEQSHKWSLPQRVIIYLKAREPAPTTINKCRVSEAESVLQLFSWLGFQNPMCNTHTKLPAFPAGSQCSSWILFS